MLWDCVKISADQILKYFSYFSQKTGFNISCELVSHFIHFFQYPGIVWCIMFALVSMWGCKYNWFSFFFFLWLIFTKKNRCKSCPKESWTSRHRFILFLQEKNHILRLLFKISCLRWFLWISTTYVLWRKKSEKYKNVFDLQSGNCYISSHT